MKIKKGFYLILGFISLALGAIGAILPILPTTPFLLLSAFCFTQSSERLHNWFVQTKLYQNNLKTLVKGQGMTKKAKIRIVSTVTLTMLLGFILMGGTVIGRIILVIAWICHLLYFILGVKTIAAETPSSDTN